MPTITDLSLEKQQLLDELYFFLDDDSNDMELRRKNIHIALNRIQVDVRRKINYVAALYRESIFVEQARSEALKSAKKRYAQSININAELKNWIEHAMTAHNIGRIECDACTLAMQNNPPSVLVSTGTIDQLPGRYLTVIPEDVKLNKKALLQDFAVGDEPFPGIEIVQTKSVRVK